MFFFPSLTFEITAMKQKSARPSDRQARVRASRVQLCRWVGSRRLPTRLDRQLVSHTALWAKWGDSAALIARRGRVAVRAEASRTGAPSFSSSVSDGAMSKEPTASVHHGQRRAGSVGEQTEGKADWGTRFRNSTDYSGFVSEAAKQLTRATVVPCTTSDELEQTWANSCESRCPCPRYWSAYPPGISSAMANIQSPPPAFSRACSHQAASDR